MSNDSLVQRVRSLEERLRVIEESLRPSAEPKPRQSNLSPREFLLKKAPKTDNDKTLVAGYYVEIVLGRDSFDFDDIEAFYAQAKEAAPENRRDPPYQLVEKGFFRKVGKRQVGKKARNRWALTNDGIARVEGGFNTRGPA